VGHVLSTAVWGLTAAMAVAWVAWRVRGRTRTVATAAFIGVLSLISIAGASVNVSRSASQAAAVKAARARASSETTRASHRADAAIDHAFDCLVADGGLSLRGVSDINQIDRRLGLFDEVLRAVREKREATQAVEGRLQVDLAGAEVPPAQREAALAAFHKEVEWEADRRILDATERVLAAGRNQLRFVRQEWGRMKVDRATGRCVFQDKKSADTFRRLSAQVLSANAVQRLAVKEAVANLGTAKPHELTPPAQGGS
jgi:hypothetical protein